MLDVKEQHETFVADYERFEKEALGGRGAWILPLRKAAIARFAELGFPTTRWEEWRFTNVAPLVKTEFELDGGAGATVSPDDIKPYVFAEAGCPTIVFVDGRFSAELSALSGLPDGVRVQNLAEAMDSETALLEPHLGRWAAFDREPFTALNTAFFEDGALIHISRGAVAKEPLHVLFVWSSGDRARVRHPRCLIVGEIESQATIVETHAGLGEGVYWTNAVTEIVARENAFIDYYKVERESESAFHTSDLHIHQGRSSGVRTHTISLGGSLVRSNFHAVLDGEGGECTLNGLSMIGGTQHVDNHLRVEHASPHCRSWEYFKNVLDDKSRAVFTGRIYVHPDAQKTDAMQTNMNLLLSDQAIADSKPQLEIFADDVKCSHGATIGQMDKDALFYLRSRGIGEEAARSLLVYAFASESIQEVRIEPLREQLESLVFTRLREGHLLRGTK